MEQVTSENQRLEASTAEYVLHINKLNDYIDGLRLRNEEETRLRKMFEAKLNALHSVCRDHEAEYARALEEISVLEDDKKRIE